MSWCFLQGAPGPSCCLRALAQSRPAWPPSGSAYASVSVAAVGVAVSVTVAAVATAFALLCCW